jgi:hypothetical protein
VQTSENTRAIGELKAHDRDNGVDHTGPLPRHGGRSSGKPGAHAEIGTIPGQTDIPFGTNGIAGVHERLPGAIARS